MFFYVDNWVFSGVGLDVGEDLRSCFYILSVELESRFGYSYGFLDVWILCVSVNRLISSVGLGV